MTSQDADNTQVSVPGRSSGLTALLGTLVVLWLVMGIAGTANYFASEDHIGLTQRAMYETGATATIEQCVDEVLEWHPRCSALSGLCDASVDRVMDECHALAARLGDTGLGVEECRGRGIERRKGQDRECSKSYGAVGAHCKALLPHVYKDIELPKVR